MTVSLLGTFNVGALENFFYDGFVSNHIRVQKFDITESFLERVNSNLFNKILNRLEPQLLLQDINKKIIWFCSNHPADVIFVCKGATILPETLNELRQYTKLLVNYNPDHPIEFYSRGSGNKNILKGIPYYDILFSYSNNICKKVADKFNIITHWIPFGYDQNLQEIKPNYTSPTGNCMFFGGYDAERASFIESLKFEDLAIYGDPEWYTRTLGKKFVRKGFQHSKLYGAELVLKVQSSNAVLNILRTQNIVENSHNMRTFEVPAMGGALVSNYTEEQAYFFEPGKEMLYYHSIDELTDKLKYLSTHQRQSIKIKENAFLRSRKSNYSYFYRVQEMITILKKHIY